ncbi:hypothetical protein Enr8_23760 [Blastopirellula retiformator]|uniref:Uncharacterized protein n=1 Tax=Blastopirellula retiformator TaxID=2527970 RepID=A0A5C5VAE4_9BACT|nr:hypothetical protein Enr8_23760 [Blastopirellula retiformator]
MRFNIVSPQNQYLLPRNRSAADARRRFRCSLFRQSGRPGFNENPLEPAQCDRIAPGGSWRLWGMTNANPHVLPRSSPLIFSTGCWIAGMRSQNSDVSRYFASREELCSEPGEVGKCHDGIFQQAVSRPPDHSLSQRSDLATGDHLLKQFHLDLAADHHRRALVNAGRFHVQ